MHRKEENRSNNEKYVISRNDLLKLCIRHSVDFLPPFLLTTIELTITQQKATPYP